MLKGTFGMTRAVPAGQQRIVDIVVESTFSIYRLRGEVRRQYRGCSSLRQSILKAAFSGQLVPQDANDEPASVLLERIAAERANAEAAKPTRGRRKKATA